MQTFFYTAGAVAVAATLLMILSLNAVHALLYLIVSFLAVAVIFYILGAPFVAALEVIVYAGAIMVLFIFIVMMLNLGRRAAEQERAWLRPSMWIGPSVLAAILLGEVILLLTRAGVPAPAAEVVGPKEVGLVLFGPYLIGVELTSVLLMGALVAAYHLGWHRPKLEKANVDDSRARGASPGGDFVRAGADRSPGTP
ncbi:MAG: NADH-quinone oxidoreductase subunit J [Candidatus Manganitrophus sp. SB1]|nr:NADH-quinone oxidoreductase subunit J [Candidatus Manganitrophus morganii]